MYLGFQGFFGLRHWGIGFMDGALYRVWALRLDSATSGLGFRALGFGVQGQSSG